MDKIRVGIVGATGLVGRTMLQVLYERCFPFQKIFCFASARSQGEEIEIQGEKIVVQETKPESFEGLDLALFASTDAGAKEYAPEAVKRGCLVIDNGSSFRLEKDVPLVVPEINSEALFSHHGIIANPNCSTIQMVMVLKPLDDAFEVQEVFVSTYQSVSGWGQQALELFEKQVCAYGKGVPLPENKAIFPYPIFNNLIPHIDRFLEDGRTKEEDKMIQETAKILGKEIPVYPLCVRVPVLYAHSEALFVKLKADPSLSEFREALSSFPGVKLLDEPEKALYPTPFHAVGQDEVLVGRVRKIKKGAFSLFVVADNLRKGAATNAIQIAEKLLKLHLLKRLSFFS